MSHAQLRLAAPTAPAAYSEADLAAAKVDAYRTGYGDGADAMQLERAHKPWLTEDEALEKWLNISR